MSYKIWYDAIGRRIHQSTEIQQLSGRDKVQLFQHLCEDLGIMQRLHEHPDETEFVQKIFVEQWDKHWNAK